jgi:uncharacterized membrane protein
MEKRSRTASTQIAAQTQIARTTTPTTTFAWSPVEEKPHVGPTQPTVYRSFVTVTVSWILQVGVVISAAFIIIGLLLFIAQGGAFAAPQLQIFPHTLNQEWRSVFALQPQAIIELGLLTLIATPVLRVMISVVAFNMEHDRRYVIIALLLLAILITSFMLGKGGL